LSPVIQSESDSENSSEESAGTATWGTVNRTPHLGTFTGNPGVKVFPSDPKEVSDIVDLFFGGSFFDLLCQETNRYYLQNHEKYDRGYKALKWVDVTSAEMKKFFGNNHSNGANQKRVTKRLMVYRSIFRNPNFLLAHEL
jgi:hypothetical protein